MTCHVFLGYDPREHEAIVACENSIKRRSKEAETHRLDDRKLRRSGIYNRPYKVLGSGQYVDEMDGRPFSTMFSFTRFVAPAYASSLKINERWILFSDCDFIFLRPIEELFEIADDRYALMCVKHQHRVQEGEKMDGVAQQNYHCKNWSSLVLWNLRHPANKPMLPQHSNTHPANMRPGSWLHRFGWIEDRDLIGEIPESWNWLSGTSPTTGVPRNTAPCAIHYTEGIPLLEGYENCEFAEEWGAEYRQL